MLASVYDPQNKAQDVFAYADTKQSRLTGTAGQIVGFDGDGNAAAQDPEGAWYGTCSTSSSIEEKVVECIGFTLKTGAQITVFFTYDNNISYPTLNVNGTGAYAIRRTTRDGNNNIGEWQSGEAIHFVFNGTYWLMTGRGTATTTYHGVTKLSISVTDTATNMAATPFAVKKAYDAATVAATAAEEAQGSIDRHMDDADAHVTAEDRAAWNGRLPLSGGTMTGPLTLSGDPTEDLQAAPKQYVDQKVLVVTVTGDATGVDEGSVNVTADRTVSEIYEAFRNGASVIAVFDGEVFPLGFCSEGKSAFYAVPASLYSEARFAHVVESAIYIEADRTVLSKANYNLLRSDYFSYYATVSESVDLDEFTEAGVYCLGGGSGTVELINGPLNNPVESGTLVYVTRYNSGVFSQRLWVSPDRYYQRSYMAGSFGTWTEVNLAHLDENGQLKQEELPEGLATQDDLEGLMSQMGEAMLFILPKPITITLPASGWSNNQQTVTATGVTADNAVTPSPAPASWEAAGAAGVRCTAQGADSLTFTCSETPTEDLTYNVLIQEVMPG